METDVPTADTYVAVRPLRTPDSTGASGSPADRAVAIARGPLAALRGLLARPLSSYYLLLASSGLLLVIGLVMVFSATSVQAYVSSGNPYASVGRQAVYALIGLIVFWLTQRLPVRTYRALGRPLMGTALILVAIEDIAVASGLSHFGPLRVDDLWLYFGPIQMQPSELGKFALALWGGAVLARSGRTEKRFRDIAGNLIPGVLLMLLLVAYGDLGTMICMAILVVGLMYAAGVRLRVFAWLAAIGFAGIIPLILVESYRLQRVTGFLSSPANCDVNKASDPCYQALEGRYAIANGGWFGVGLGQGHLKWGRLPNAHNDFIFALIAEELGVVGCFVVLALLGVLAYTGFRIARRSADPFRRIVATGITTWLVGQATINIGGVIGVLPITGLPLPFISDGGSALVVVLAAIGVLASFARAEPDAARALNARPPERWVRLAWAPLPPLPRPDDGAESRVRRPRPDRALAARPRDQSVREDRSRADRGSGSRDRGGRARAGRSTGDATPVPRIRSEQPRVARPRPEPGDSGDLPAARTRSSRSVRDGAAGRPPSVRDGGPRERGTGRPRRRGDN